MNAGLSEDILELLNKETDMWVKDMYRELKKTYPNLLTNQLSATLSSLKRYGKVLHLCKGGWACIDYPNR